MTNSVPPPPPQLNQESTRDNESAERYERLINTIPCALYDYVRWPDGCSQFCYISPRCAEIFGYTPNQIIADANLLWSLVHPDDFDRLQREDDDARETGIAFQTEARIVLASGVTKWIQLNSRRGDYQVEGQDLWSGVILDITDRKQLENERNHLVTELQAALAEVKILNGFIPICACCKKIRDDRGYWNQLEAYLSEHSNLEFSHGICPDCTKTYYNELAKPDQPTETIHPA